MNDTQLKALQLAMLNLDKQFGKNTVVLGQFQEEDIDVVSTGNFKLDLALGVDGLPRGRVVEIFSAEGLGKTLIATNTVAQAQAAGLTCAYVDAECDLDGRWLRFQGVNTDELILCQPEHGEQALDVAIALAKTGAVDVIVIDSVAALVPKAELDGDMEDKFMGLQARMMGQALRKMRQILHENNVLMIFINQVRDKIGPMPGTTTPGGRALKFAASIRIDIRKVEQIKNKATGEILGVRVKATTVKNKVASPMKSCEYDILHGKGFNNTGSIIELAEKFGYLVKSGTWYKKVDLETGEISEKAFAQGIDQACVFLDEDPTLLLALKEKIKEKVKGTNDY